MDTHRDLLIVVDVQNDFCPGGALAVPDGDAIIPVINSVAGRFFRVAATQDWHPEDHISFASNHEGKKPYDTVYVGDIPQTLWPDHCVAGSAGADFHPELRTAEFDLIIRKGTDPAIDSYSAFVENDRTTRTGLEGYLKALDIERVFLCGLATDFCILYSALDSARLGFQTHVIIDACRGIDIPENSIAHSIDTMKKKGITILNSGEIQ